VNPFGEQHPPQNLGTNRAGLFGHKQGRHLGTNRAWLVEHAPPKLVVSNLF